MTLQSLSAQQKQHNTSLSKMKEYDGFFKKVFPGATSVQKRRGRRWRSASSCGFLPLVHSHMTLRWLTESQTAPSIDQHHNFTSSWSHALFVNLPLNWQRAPKSSTIAWPPLLRKEESASHTSAKFKDNSPKNVLFHTVLQLSVGLQ